jgi:hypothetical protein
MRSNRRWTLNLMGLAVALGLLAGIMAPKPSSAVSLYNVYVHPTADTLTCGWHQGACWDYPTVVPSGWALDWKPCVGNSSFTVYLFTK